jgi:uncharacterized protein
MNQQEKEALQSFLDEMRQVRVQNKDWEAEALIMDAVRQQPDAPYLLVQRALLQEQALNNAQQRIATLQQQLASNQHAQSRPASPSGGSGNFLDPTSQWGRSGRAIAQTQAVGRGQAAPGLGDGGYGSNGSYRGNPGVGGARAFYDTPPGRPGLMGGGMGSFLGSMAGVAAGVAAGSFLYHGIDNLMHHNDHQTGSQTNDQSNHQSNDQSSGFADMAGDPAGDVATPASSEQFLDDGGVDGGSMAQDAGIDDIGSSGDNGGDNFEGGGEEYI